MIVVPRPAWQSRQQRRHPRHVAVGLIDLIGAAEHDVVDDGPADVAMPAGQLANDVCGQVVRAHAGERTAVPADWRADAQTRCAALASLMPRRHRSRPGQHQ